MARPSDWSAVDMQLDPVPGDPAEIRQSASGARSIEQAITEQVNRLNSLKDGEGWESESGTKFRDSAGDLAGAIEKAKGRYTELAAALDQWADGLEGLQREADAALLQAQDARDAHRAAANQTITAEADSPEHQDQVDAQDRALSAAQSDIDAAKAIIHRLAGPFGEEGEYGELAGRVADRIRQGADDGLKDGWFDHVKQAIHGARGVINVIKDALDALGPVLLLATVLAALFIPGALFAIAVIGLVAAGTKLLLTSAQAVAGDATAGDVTNDAVMFALSAVGLKAASAAKPAMQMLRATVGTKTASEAAAGVVARGGSVAEETNAFLRGATRGVDPAKAVGNGRSVRLADNLISGGLAEAVMVRKLAWNAPLMREAYIRAVKPSLVTIETQALGNMSTIQTLGDVKTDLQSGWNSYWHSKTEIHVGSL